MLDCYFDHEFGKDHCLKPAPKQLNFESKAYSSLLIFHSELFVATDSDYNWLDFGCTELGSLYSKAYQN